MDFSKQKEVGRQAVKKAGVDLEERFERLTLAEKIKKSKHEIVTPADYAAEEQIIDAVQKKFPSHNILSEEAGKVSLEESDFLWVVDPLDGTTNFSIKNPFFAVSVGLFYKKEPILAFVYAPTIDEFFEAEKNEGATLNGEAVKVSKRGEIADSNLAFCHGREKNHLRKSAGIYSRLKLDAHTLRQYGSASLETAFVACGRLEALMIPGVNVWDIAAGVLLVREAGGKVTDFEGKKWNLKSDSILASNGRVHEKVLDCLSDL